MVKNISRRGVIYLTSGILIIVAVIIYFVSLYFDPIINYYGVRMRESQFTSFLLTHTLSNPDFGLFCIAQPLTNLHEQSICFDSEVEVQRFDQRRIEVERQLSGEL
jgi:hypothetical protein